MTAINVFLKRDTAVMMTDAAMYTSDGTVVGFGQKVVSMPSLSAAIAIRGNQKATALLAMELPFRFRSFDEMMAGCEEFLPDWFADNLMWLAQGGQQDLQIVVAGISKDGPAGFYFDSTEGGEGFGHIDGDVISPLLDDAGWNRLSAQKCEPGEDYDTKRFHPLRHGVPLMEAQRRMKIVPAGLASEPISIVGGHILLTEIDRTAISQRIVHRWADVCGEPIRTELAL